MEIAAPAAGRDDDDEAGSEFAFAAAAAPGGVFSALSATGSVEPLDPGEAEFAGVGLVRSGVFAEVRSGSGDAPAVSDGAACPGTVSEDVVSANTLPKEAGTEAGAAFEMAVAPEEIAVSATGAVFNGNAAGALTGAVKGNRVAKTERIAIERA